MSLLYVEDHYIQNSKEAFVKNNIKKRTICFDVLKKNDRILLNISDNAGGISDTIIPHIFDSHFTTKQNDGGTGIGLYLSKQILEKIDASIKVKNIENGVCFTLLL